jgi:hypothetical protein
MANVILQATNDITFAAPITIAQQGVGITAQANNDILVNENITTNGGAVNLIGDMDGSGAAESNIYGASSTRGGDITVNGTSNSTNDNAMPSLTTARSTLGVGRSPSTGLALELASRLGALALKEISSQGVGRLISRGLAIASLASLSLMTA